MCNNSLIQVVNFYKKIGHLPVQSKSCWWYDPYNQNKVLFAFPLHRMIDLQNSEANEVFRQVRTAWALRFISPLTEKRGVDSFIWVCKKPYDLDYLDVKNRYKVRLSLRNCEVRQITFAEVIQYGREARADTNQRHGEISASDDVHVRLDECNHYEAWGAFCGDALAAYMVTLCVEDWAHIIVHRSANRFFKAYPNNGLVFSVKQALLSRENISTVSYGWASLEDHATLDHFKLSVGSFQQPVKQRLVLRPWLRPFLNPLVCRLFSVVRMKLPENSKISKLSGLLSLASRG